LPTGTAFFVVLRGALQSLFDTRYACRVVLTTESVQAAKPLAAIAAVTFLADRPVRCPDTAPAVPARLRMTRTENKRERKELEGDPLIRRERRRHRVLQVAGAMVNVGISRAVIAIMHGNRVVGIRYRMGETPFLRRLQADGEAGVAMLAELRERGSHRR